MKLDVESCADKPVFVGIAKTEAVDDYLRGVAHTELEDLDVGPFDRFDPDYADHAAPSPSSSEAR